MPTVLYGNVDYAQVAQAIDHIERNSKRIKGVSFPDFEKFSFPDKARREAEIRQLASDCGCKLGAQIAGVATLLYLFVTYIGLISFTSRSAINYAVAVLVFLVGGVAGKLIALSRIKRQLEIISSEVRNEIVAEMGIQSTTGDDQIRSPAHPPGDA